MYFITTSDIIDGLSKDGRFKSICKKIAKRPFLADELYQEFFLALCEIKDRRLIEAQAGGYLEVFCVGIINNIWTRRDRVKSYRTGNTHPLHMITEYCLTISNKENADGENTEKNGEIFESHLPGEEFDLDGELQNQFAQSRVRELIEEAKESIDPSQRFRARVFDYSTFKYKDPRKFSRISGIPYYVCRRATADFKKYLEKNINGIHLDRCG